MVEYEIRQEIYKKIQERITAQINEFCDSIQNKNELYFYPIMAIEKRFLDVDPNHYLAMKDKKVINWFIKKVFERVNFNDIVTTYNFNDFQKFYDKKLPEVQKMFDANKLANDIKKVSTIGTARLINVYENTYEIQEAFVDDNMLIENVYYYGMDDKEIHMQEQHIKLMPVKSLVIRYGDKDLKKCVEKLKIAKSRIDKEVLQLCIESVLIDIDKIADKFKSRVVSNKKELSQILGYFYYYAIVHHQICSLSRLNNTLDIKKHYYATSEAKMIREIIELFSISDVKVKRYIEYFTFNGVGSLDCFPLVTFNGNIHIIPSFIMLNDWQFSIVQGHKFKNIEIINRKGTVSEKVENDLIKKITKLSNIKVTSSYNYKFYDKEKEEISSDIDILIYDKNHNIGLVIECKWKGNHYDEIMEKDYRKISETFNKMFSQLGKHEKLLMDLDRINNIFKLFDISFKDGEQPKFEYVGVDIRNQLHVDEKHMISLFALKFFIERNIIGDQLNLEAVINSINSLSTNIDYFDNKKRNFIVLDKETNLICDYLDLQYNLL